MPETVFYIKKLFCSYDLQAENAVLYIDDLEIKKGEIVFLLGSSGSGKSTLLETLGLMNNTIAAGDVSFNAAGHDPVSFRSLWEEDEINKASEVRKSNFSFIFQNTNLMENFTAYENVSLARMIQKHSSQDEAMHGAKLLMERVGLPLNEVPIDRLSVNLSGGQKQRVTFVRALNSDCTVLFGDEPTGNLDEGNANELMNVVKGYMAEKGLTVIIVSHDINLALNHASRIVCLTKNLEKGYGEVLAENNFPRSVWESFDAGQVHEFKAKIRSFYTRKVREKNQTDNKKEEDIKLTKTYTSLFLNKEGKALAGKGYSSMAILIMLLVCTFLAIGFANGSLAYLREKLDNPFVNWLTIDIPSSKSRDQENVRSMIRTINDHKSEFFIKSVNSFSERPLSFYTSDMANIIPTRARSVTSATDQLIQAMFEKQNQLEGEGEKPFVGDNDMSVIVSQRFMHDHGYKGDEPFIYYEDHETNDSSSTRKRIQFKIPIGVRAVVKEMPGKTQIIYTDYLNKAMLQSHGNTFDLRNKSDFIIFLYTDRENAKKICLKIKKYLKDSQWSNKDQTFDVQLPTHDSTTTHYDGYDILITPTQSLGTDDWQLLFNDIVSHTNIPPKMLPSYYFGYDNFTPDFSIPPEVDKLSVIFSKLDKVRDFATYFLKTFNSEEEIGSGRQMEVDLTSVKEKENFNFLSHITSIVSCILIIFGTISVVLFVFNLLKMHLSKVKMNIGTFKAFGLSNSEAQNIYFLIVLRFIIISLVISILASWGLGSVLNKILIDYNALERGSDYFILNFKYTYITLGLIFVSALAVSWFTIRAMLSKSPGDLIYNR